MLKRETCKFFPKKICALLELIYCRICTSCEKIVGQNHVKLDSKCVNSNIDIIDMIKLYQNPSNAILINKNVHKLCKHIESNSKKWKKVEKKDKKDKKDRNNH